VQKLDASFMSSQRPSKLMLLWNVLMSYFHQEAVFGAMKSGKTESPGHT
jgi:hypothetical protein